MGYSWVGLPPIRGAERVLGAGKKDADRANGQVEGRGNLSVGIARMTEQQALALALWDFREGAPYSGTLFLADKMARGTGELAFEGFLVGALEAANPLESRPCSLG